MLKWLFGKEKNTNIKLVTEMTKKKYIFEGFHADSSCNYHIFSYNQQNFLVVEQLEETTTSITNKIEEIIINICQIEAISQSHLRIFEYYPSTTLSIKYPIEIQEVKLFDGNPNWYPVTDETSRIIKSKVVPG